MDMGPTHLQLGYLFCDLSVSDSQLSLKQFIVNLLWKDIVVWEYLLGLSKKVSGTSEVDPESRPSIDGTIT